MRTYEKTHPWLSNLHLNTKELNFKTWLKLGEAVSKMEHIAGSPLNPEAAAELHQVYLAKGVLATTAIEGNTLTEKEVRDHLDGKLSLPPSRQYLSQEIDNIVGACNRIGLQIISDPNKPLDCDEIIEFNKAVLEKLPVDEDVVPGKIRTHDVVAGRYRCAPPEDCRYLLEQFCKWINEIEFPTEKDLKPALSILIAITAHLYFVWIHPFGDGNGRTARLIEFRYLLQTGFPTPAAHLLSNFYNLTRTEYYRHLDRASQTQGEMTHFIEYAVNGLVDQLKEQLTIINNLQLDNAWENYIHKQNLGKGQASASRRRKAVLALSNHKENNGWVHINKIQDLSPELARAYARKTHKTMTRDINVLEEAKLLIIVDRMVKANKGRILAFLPDRAKADK